MWNPFRGPPSNFFAFAGPEGKSAGRDELNFFADELVPEFSTCASMLMNSVVCLMDFRLFDEFHSLFDGFCSLFDGRQCDSAILFDGASFCLTGTCLTDKSV